MDVGPAKPISSEDLVTLLSSNNNSADAVTETDTPAELNVTLMKHQRMALNWMANREVMKKAPNQPHGGILADDQGFGMFHSFDLLL